MQDNTLELRIRLECNHLKFTYPGSKITVINDLSFSMEKSGFKALFGPSGVGKTSLAKIIANMNTRFKGDILTENIDTILYSYNLERLPGWSSTGNHLYKVTAPEKQALKETLVSIFELQEVLDSRFSQLSMGQQNRINLIRYLLQDFDLLILDESLANVDEKLRETIILAIKKLFADKMFFYISHNLMEVSKFIAANAGIGYSIRIALYQSDLGKILVALFMIGIIISIYQGILETIGDQIKNRWTISKQGETL